MQVDFDDEKVGNRSSALKFKSNTWNRFCILDEKAEYAKVHYKNGYRVCTAHEGPYQDPQKRCAYCQALTKEAFDRFAVNVCHYMTDPQGQPFGDLGPRSFVITWWPFSTDRWETVRMLKKTYGDLRKNDILFHCTEENYQKGDMHIAPPPQPGMPSAWWLMNPDFKKIVATRYRDERTDLSKKLARHLTYEQQLQELAGQPTNDQRGGQQGHRGGGQPMFNPGAVQGMIAPPMGGMPLFGGGGNGGPRFSQQSTNDLGLLDTGSAPSGKQTAPTPSVDNDLPDLGSSEGQQGSGPDTSDLDAMLAEMK